jgi:hypothetical protein
MPDSNNIVLYLLNIQDYPEKQRTNSLIDRKWIEKGYKLAALA